MHESMVRNAIKHTDEVKDKGTVVLAFWGLLTTTRNKHYNERNGVIICESTRLQPKMYYS